MYENQIIYYGLAGARECYRVLEFYRVKSADYTIENEKRFAMDMLGANPGIERMFVLTNGYRLKKDYRAAVTANSIEGWAIFKDLMERQGREIDIRPLRRELGN